ncbi:MAG TPA: hypothetical protein V6D47_00160 [Oscillatoriaceae cyanobacterium]
MPIAEALVSRVPSIFAKPVLESRAKVVAASFAEPSLRAMSKDTLETAASKVGGDLAKSSENPGPIAKGFWWIFNKIASAVVDGVHKAAYGH